MALLKRSVKGFHCFFVVNYIVKITGERIRELRTEKGLSCVILGKEIGVSDSVIVRWENNKHDIKGIYLVRLAKFFGVTTDYLLGLENRK